MSDPTILHKKGGNENGKRNLPSWMSSRQDVTSSHRNRQAGNCSQDEGRPKMKGGHVEEQSRRAGSEDAGQATQQFSKLLEGVVFVLSGLVNPERGTVRSQALEMGAEYRPDWTSDCTLLVCAFPNTPKFRQVEEDGGTIVSKDWISECYNQRKLVEIERYLMHVGKPWRINANFFEASQDQENVLSDKLQDQAERTRDKKMITSAQSKDGASWSVGRKHLSPSKVKEWAANDLAKTVSWLESQKEKPEPDEVKKIAAEGIITCLQDAIAALEQNQDIGRVIEQWKFVPRVAKELAELEAGRSQKGSLTKEELSKLAINCKQIYETKFDNLLSSPVESKKLKAAQGDDDEGPEVMPDAAAVDSDSTIEMTEEEIDLACKGSAYPENFDW